MHNDMRHRSHASLAFFDTVNTIALSVAGPHWVSTWQKTFLGLSRPHKRPDSVTPTARERKP